MTLGGQVGGQQLEAVHAVRDADAPAGQATGAQGTVLLVGMMGAGKTTVGRMLADRLDRRYVDSDEEVEAATGRTVRELFEEGGEKAFRPLESAALATAVHTGQPVVVGVAGGAVLDPANRALLRRSGTVVWLRATPETLAARIAHQVGTGSGGARRDHRPLLEHDPEGALRHLAASRRPLYEEVADLVVDVDGVSPADVVERVVAALSSQRRDASRVT